MAVKAVRWLDGFPIPEIAPPAPPARAARQPRRGGCRGPQAGPVQVRGRERMTPGGRTRPPAPRVRTAAHGWARKRLLVLGDEPWTTPSASDCWGGTRYRQGSPQHPLELGVNGFA